MYRMHISRYSSCVSKFNLAFHARCSFDENFFSSYTHDIEIHILPNMDTDLIVFPSNARATVNVKLANRFNFENNYLQKKSRPSHAPVFATGMGPKGPAIHDIFRGTILSQIYFDLMETSEDIFDNFKLRLVEGKIVSQEAADHWANIFFAVGKTAPKIISVMTKFREDISQQRLALWKYYKTLFFALRPAIFRGAFDHVLPGRTPDSYIGQTVQYGETFIHGLFTTPEPGTIPFLRNLNHFCGLPSTVVDSDFEFGENTVNIFEEFVFIVDSICEELYEYLNILVQEPWFDGIDTVNPSMKALLELVFNSVEHWGDQSGVDFLNSNVYDILRDFHRAGEFLFNQFDDDGCAIKGLSKKEDRDLAAGGLWHVFNELHHKMECLRCSHVWVILGFGTHPDSSYHVINPAGFWKSNSVFKHVESPEFWLEKINWESMGAYLKLGWVIFNGVHEKIPYPKQESFSVSTPWRSDEQNIINREVVNRMPSVHKFETWIQTSFEDCFVESVDVHGTVNYNHRKWILFKSGILNFVAFPKGKLFHHYI